MHYTDDLNAARWWNFKVIKYCNIRAPRHHFILLLNKYMYIFSLCMFAPLYNDSIACIKYTCQTYCVEPVCKWFSVLIAHTHTHKMCACSKVFIAKSCRFFYVVDREQYSKQYEKKRKQEAQKIAIITEHIQTIFLLRPFFQHKNWSRKKSKHRNFVDQTPSFVYLHSWHWVALVIIVVAVAVIIAAIVRSAQQQQPHAYILLEFL